MVGVARKLPVAAALRVALVALTTAPQGAATFSPTEDGNCGASGLPSCAAARGGSALLQTAQQEKEKGRVVAEDAKGKKHISLEAQANLAKSKSKSAPLKLRLDTLEKTTTELKERVTNIEQDVGMSSVSPAALEQDQDPIDFNRRPPKATPAAVEEDVGVEKQHGFSVPLAPELVANDEESAEDSGSDDFLGSAGADEQPSSLLEEGSMEIRTKEDTIKSRVMSLETDMAGLKSQVAALENQVMGSTAFLFQKSSKASGSSLKSRIMSLEDEADNLRTRVSTLEHQVSGGP